MIDYKPMPASMEQIVNLAKRRGFVFPSAEIYGGLGGFWDWAPLGVLLKNNIKREWWRTFVQSRSDMVGLDGSIVTNPKVWEASGHAANFVDFAIQCKKCKQMFKAENILPTNMQESIKTKTEHEVTLLALGKTTPEETTKTMSLYLHSLEPQINDILKCAQCSEKDWNFIGYVSGMFKTAVGPVAESEKIAYLRPETAQSIFVNYEQVRESMRKKLPFGIAQIGKAFRNEITPGNFVFRQREFEQMEIEYFVKPGDDDREFAAWVEACYEWFLSLGLSPKHMRKFEQPKSELAHYSKATTDIEYAFPIEKGWGELMGIANRTDYDLRQHGQFAKGSPEAFATPVDDEGKVKKVPFVIEPSMGVDRAALAFLLDAYTVIDGGRSTTTDSIKAEEVVLKLHPRLAPYTVAVLPLSKKLELTSVAEKILGTLRQEWMVDYDLTGSIGKRYRRQDEIGTPFCITVDFDTLEGVKRPKNTVTIRDRDSMAQEDIGIEELVDYFRTKLA